MIKRQTLTSQVFDYVLNLIKTNQVKPGEKLPTEKQLTDLLGVSRTCVREAVKSLETLRLISVRQRIGAVVLEPSPTALFNAEHLSAASHQQTADCLIEFRRILEIGLAPLAAEKATEEDLAVMSQALERHKRAIETDMVVAHDADIAFHRAVAEATKNPFVLMVLDTVSGPLAEQRRMNDGIRRFAEEGLRDHERIYYAIKQHNPEKARAAMRAHMDTAERNWRLAAEIRRAGGNHLDAMRQDAVGA